MKTNMYRDEDAQEQDRELNVQHSFANNFY